MNESGYGDEYTRVTNTIRVKVGVAGCSCLHAGVRTDVVQSMIPRVVRHRATTC